MKSLTSLKLTDPKSRKVLERSPRKILQLCRADGHCVIEIRSRLTQRLWPYFCHTMRRTQLGLFAA